MAAGTGCEETLSLRGYTVTEEGQNSLSSLFAKICSGSTADL